MNPKEYRSLSELMADLPNRLPFVIEYVEANGAVWGDANRVCVYPIDEDEIYYHNLKEPGFGDTEFVEKWKNGNATLRLYDYFEMPAACAPAACTCSIPTLMQGGCQCGAFQKEKEEKRRRA